MMLLRRSLDRVLGLLISIIHTVMKIHQRTFRRSNIPTIEYHINDVKHVYFPDFFIKSENKIIEVKSEWTIQLRRGNVQEKGLATIKAGYKYEIWIYNVKKVKVETRVY